MKKKKEIINKINENIFIRKIINLAADIII